MDQNYIHLHEEVVLQGGLATESLRTLVYVHQN